MINVSATDLFFLSLKQLRKPVLNLRRVTVFCILLALTSCFSASLLANGTFAWRYTTNKNKFDDKISTTAWAYTANYKYQNNFSVGFKCAEGRLHFEIDVGTFITGKGESFEFQYRVDNQKTKTIKMKTFSHSNNGGTTYHSAKKIATDIIGGKKMAARAIGWSNEFFDADISLAEANVTVTRVFEDCLIHIAEETNPLSEDNYSLTDFLNDFKKLTPKLQKHILKGIKNLMS